MRLSAAGRDDPPWRVVVALVSAPARAPGQPEAALAGGIRASPVEVAAGAPRAPGATRRDVARHREPPVGLADTLAFGCFPGAAEVPVQSPALAATRYAPVLKAAAWAQGARSAASLGGVGYSGSPGRPAAPQGSRSGSADRPAQLPPAHCPAR